MKIHHLFSSLIFILAVTLTSFAQNVTCPTPTVPVGNRCVLDRNFDLTQTIVLPSNATLDCEGRRLRPSSTGTPQVAIFLNGVRNVLIKRCVIEGFDFGVFAINSKRPGLPFQSFAMFENTITARYTGITLMAVDNAEIIDNVVTYQRRGGKALYIGRDSDMNGVSKNTFIADVASANAADTEAFAAPGRESASTNPKIIGRKAAVLITHLEGDETTLQHVVVNGTLFQVVNTFVFDTQTNHSFFSEANRVEGNIIRFLRTPTDGIALAIAHGTHVIGNAIESGAERAIRMGAQYKKDRKFPGRCRRRPSPFGQPPVVQQASSLGRPCLENSDCPVSTDPTRPFECAGAFTQTVNWTTNDSLIQGNIITGPFDTGIASTGWETRIIGNTIVWQGSTTTTRNIGIGLFGKFALESGVVRANSVSNVPVALALVKRVCLPGANQEFTDCDPDAGFFGAQISLNDFTGYITGVRTSVTNGFLSSQGVYDVPSELSAFGTSVFPFRMGNFWGTGNCQGPTGVVRNPDGTINLVVSDSRSYNQPVANKPLTPSPCP